MLGLNRLKLGVFSMNTDGGLTLTRVPERWPALWSETMEVAQLADRAGLEFLLPIARWKGFGGEMNSREWSFETLTHAAGLAGVTQRIGVLATVHVPMVHPVFAAKALATLDHISNGRSGLNIVCGWNPEEFALFGLELIEDRYAQGLEWFDIVNRIYTAAEQAYCLRKRNAAESLAARFAAKEAGAKALGTGISHGISWREIEVVREPGGRPNLKFHGRAAQIAAHLGVARAALSLTHTAQLAVASVVIEDGR